MKIVKCLGICLLAILLSAGLGSCSSDDEYSSRLRELIIKDLTFDPDEEENSLSRTSTFRNEDLTNYRAVPDASWCHVSFDVAKSQMTVTVDENNSYDVRKTIVTLSDVLAPEVTRTFTVTQKQNNVIRVSPTSIEAKTKGGLFEISFEHNVNDYKIECDADWVDYKVENSTRGISKSTITISVAENQSGVARWAAMTIESESTYEPVNITISQEYEMKETFNLLDTYYEIDELGGNVSVGAQTNMTSFTIFEPQDLWARLGELEFFPDLVAVVQHVNVSPFTAKEPSRTTTLYFNETITITQYRNLYIKESGFSILRGESKSLSVYTKDGEAVSWSSSDESVATVDANGKVTGVGVGTATITASSSNGKYKDSVPVTIEKPEDLRDYLDHEWQPYFDGDEVESLACTLNNGSKHNIQLTRVEIYSDLKMLSFTNYNEKSGALAVGDSKKVSFEGLKGKGGKFGFTVVWYYTFNGEKFTYRCEYTL